MNDAFSTSFVGSSFKAFKAAVRVSQTSFTTSLELSAWRNHPFPKVKGGKLRASSETPTLHSYKCWYICNIWQPSFIGMLKSGLLQVTCAKLEVLKIRYRNVTPCPDYCLLDIYSANTCRSINAAFVPNGSQEENVQPFSSLNNSRQKIVQVGEAFLKSLIIHLGSHEILPGSWAHPPQTITFTFSMAIWGMSHRMGLTSPERHLDLIDLYLV